MAFRLPEMAARSFLYEFSVRERYLIMKALDRVLLAVLALGIWGLVIGQFFSPNPVYSQAGLDRREIRQAINNCQVQGPISSSHINAMIVCR